MSAGAARLPAGAGAVAHAAMELLRRRLARKAKLFALRPPIIVPLDTDWRTEGNWLGRYGTYFADLGAMRSPKDIDWGAGWRGNGQFIGPRIGSHVTRQLPLIAQGDIIRRWIETLYTADRRMLEMPKPYLDKCWLTGLAPTRALFRRGAEWDDHGEAYPAYWQGPGIYCPLHLPPGLFRLAIYSVNMDGHSGPMRYRDYTCDILYPPQNTPNTGYFAVRAAPRWRVLATRRICDFWGGVWTPFLVRGPVTICIHFGRNYSLNTMVSAVTFSLYAALPMPYSREPPPAALAAHQYQMSVPGPRRIAEMARKCEVPLGFGAVERLPATPAAVEAGALFGGAIDAMRLRNCAVAAGRLSAKARRAMELRKAGWLWQTHRFRAAERLERQAGLVTPRQVELRLKWNEVDSTSGTDGALVRAYMAGHHLWNNKH